MKRWLQLASAIDRFTEAVGRVLWALVLVMIAAGAYSALARYTDPVTGWNLSSNRWVELQWYAFAAVFLLGAAYGLRHDAHVRVDVGYAWCSTRTKAWINLMGTLLFLGPFCVLMIDYSWPMVYNAWATWEQSPDPGGLPRYPIKTVIPVAFGLLLVQGAAVVIRHVAYLRGRLPADKVPMLAGD
ncbi:TRAP transporter small permease subunit [Salisaeta longa]|uniref:TRAP transporter small permease subunit n=1 Tax=Salisaeta longa TaxID=503170 RepID=UPI0003B48F13|nr:TRAP transporter small permease subunit [Salisaeta longa]